MKTKSLSLVITLSMLAVPGFAAEQTPGTISPPPVPPMPPPPSRTLQVRASNAFVRPLPRINPPAVQRTAVPVTPVVKAPTPIAAPGTLMNPLPPTSGPLIKPLPPTPVNPLASKPGATNAPRIAFAGTIHDFGKIAAGEIAKCEFVFTNIGGSTLQVTEVRPGCGCTTAGQWTRTVEPGKTGIIPLQFNSANFNGAVTKSATVTCNDPIQPTTFLQLKAYIWRAIDVSPQFAMLNVTTESPSNFALVKIINNLDQPLTLSEPQSQNAAFAAELQTVKPGKEFNLLVKTVPPFPTRNVQGMVSVKTSSTNMPLINISAWANYQPTVMAMPAQIVLPPGRLATNQTMNIWVRNNGTNTITLTAPSISVSNATVQVKDFQPGRYFSVIVTFPAGLELNPAEKPEVTIKTSHPQYPVLRIPIIQPRPYMAPVRPAIPNPVAQPATVIRPAGH